MNKQVKNRARLEIAPQFVRTAISTAVLTAILSGCGGGSVEFTTEPGTIEFETNQSSKTIYLSDYVIGESAHDLAYEIRVLPANGLLTIHNDTVTYIPDEDFTGTDSFEYIVINQSGIEKTNIITIDVRAKTEHQAEKAIVKPALHSSMTTSYKIQTNSSIPIMAYANDPAAQFQLITPPEFGELIRSDDQFEYTPITGFVGEDQFEIEATDSYGQSLRILITIKVVDLPGIDHNTVSDDGETEIGERLAVKQNELFYLSVEQAQENTEYEWQQTAGDPALIFQDGKGHALIQANSAVQFALFAISDTDQTLIETRELSPQGFYQGNPFSFDFLPFDAQLVTSTNTHAFVFVVDIGIVILDITDINFPQIVNVYHSDRFVEKLALHSKTLYAVGYNYIDKIDISQPNTPLSIDRIDRIEHLDPVDIQIHGSDAYVTTRANEIIRINLSDGSYSSIVTPSEIPTVLSSSGEEILTSTDSTINLHSITSDTPEFTTNIQFDYLEDIVLHGDNIFLVDTGNFKVFDRSSELLFEQRLNSTFEASISIQGQYALVKTDNKGVYVFDVTDPFSIQFIGNYNSEYQLVDATLTQDQLILLDANSKLRVVDLFSNTTPRWASESFTSGSYYSALRLQDYLYIGNEGQGLQTLEFDASDPLNISWSSGFWSPAFNYRLQYIDDLLVTSGRWSGVTLYDTEINPDDPDLIIQYQTGDARGAAIYENTMIVANGYLGVSFFDMDFPENIISFETSGNAYAVALHQHYALVADSGMGIRVFDMSEPALPVHLYDFEINGWPYDIVVENNIAYVAAGTAGVVILDINDIEHPEVIAEFNPSSATLVKNLRFFEGELYIPAGDSGAYVVNVNDPSQPFLTGHYHLPDRSHSLDVDRDYIYNISYYSGLTVSDNSKPQLSEDYTLETTNSIVRYEVSWASIDDLSLNCAVTSGNCYLYDIDLAEGTALAEWEIGTIPGDQRIEITVGNSVFYRKTFDSITIE